MKSLFRFISAKRRLEEITKTIEAMGGEDAPPTLHAQYDMTKMESKYYKKMAAYEFFVSVIFIITIAIAIDIYNKIG